MSDGEVMSDGELVPTEAVFYVRSGLDRAIHAMKREIKEAEQYIKLNPEMPTTVKGSLEGMIEYHQQWLAEAREAFRTLPVGLQPPNMYK